MARHQSKIFFQEWTNSKIGESIKNLKASDKFKTQDIRKKLYECIKIYQFWILTFEIYFKIQIIINNFIPIKILNY